MFPVAFLSVSVRGSTPHLRKGRAALLGQVEVLQPAAPPPPPKGSLTPAGADSSLPTLLLSPYRRSPGLPLWNSTKLLLTVRNKLLPDVKAELSSKQRLRCVRVTYRHLKHMQTAKRQRERLWLEPQATRTPHALRKANMTDRLKEAGAPSLAHGY